MVSAGDHFEGALNGMIWTMAAMTATVGGVTACIFHPMMRSSQSDFVCVLQKTKGSAVISKDGLQGGVFQAVASLSHCGGKREMLAKELTLLHSALETSIGPSH